MENNHEENGNDDEMEEENKNEDDRVTRGKRRTKITVATMIPKPLER